MEIVHLVVQRDSLPVCNFPEGPQDVRVHINRDKELSAEPAELAPNAL